MKVDGRGEMRRRTLEVSEAWGLGNGDGDEGEGYNVNRDNRGDRWVGEGGRRDSIVVAGHNIYRLGVSIDVIAHHERKTSASW